MSKEALKVLIVEDDARLAASTRVLLERELFDDAVCGDDHVIDVHISNLRRKLGNPRFVTTVRGYGYRMGESSN